MKGPGSKLPLPGPEFLLDRRRLPRADENIDPAVAPHLRIAEGAGLNLVGRHARLEQRNHRQRRRASHDYVFHGDSLYL